jgi:predicted dehydrogenase
MAWVGETVASAGRGRSVRRRISFGVVGLGSAGSALARSLSELPQTELRWLCDRSKKARSRLRAHYPRVRLASDLSDLLEDQTLEAVVVASPPSSHHEIARRALQSGKHVLIQGGLALGRHADELVGLSEERGLRLMIGHAVFFNPAVRKLKELIELGSLGNVYYVSANRHEQGLGRAGNDLWALAREEVSMTLFLVGGEPIQVFVRGDSYSRRDSADVLNCHLRFENNVSARLHLSRVNAVECRRLTVVGSKATAVFDDGEPRRKLAIHANEGTVLIPQLSGEDPVRLECDCFVSSIRFSARSVAGAREGAVVAKVLEDLRQAYERDTLARGHMAEAVVGSTVVPLRRSLSG